MIELPDPSLPSVRVGTGFATGELSVYPKQGCLLCSNEAVNVILCHPGCPTKRRYGLHTHYACRCGRRFIVVGE